MEPDILVLDEPTSNLDISARRSFIELLKSFHHTILLATHDIEMASELCPRALLIKDGTIIADRPTARLLADKELLIKAGMNI